jgi:hypothetical protein
VAVLVQQQHACLEADGDFFLGGAHVAGVEDCFAADAGYVLVVCMVWLGVIMVVMVGRSGGGGVQSRKARGKHDGVSEASGNVM